MVTMKRVDVYIIVSYSLLHFDSLQNKNKVYSPDLRLRFTIWTRSLKFEDIGKQK